MSFDFTITQEEIQTVMADQDLSEPKARYVVRRLKVREALEAAETVDDLKCVIRKMLEWTL
jgi:hypothetical protein